MKMNLLFLLLNNENKKDSYYTVFFILNISLMYHGYFIISALK